MGKVMALVVGVFMLGALAVPAGAYSFTSMYGTNPLGTFYSGSPLDMGGLSSIYGPFGPFSTFGAFGGGLGGFGGLSGFGSPFSGLSSPFGFGSSFGNGITGSDLGQVSPIDSGTDLFSNTGSSSPFGDMFGGSIFDMGQYGTPPTDVITNTLVGQTLSYDSGFMGIPLQYKIEKSDIGAITGTQYQGQAAWKVRVGADGLYWDVILNSAGTTMLAANQVQ